MPGDPRIRASDADRERTTALLREHHAEGRLSAEEFNDRLDRALAAKTIGELDELLADLPGIDLYRLPAAGIRPAPPGALRPRSAGSARGAGDVERRGSGAVSPQRAATWVAWAAISSLLFVAWLGLGLVSGGAAWVPWFLLVVVPWGMVIARRPPDHP
jgi:Domain of unknown function (DUF1707)